MLHITYLLEFSKTDRLVDLVLNATLYYRGLLFKLYNSRYLKM